MKWDIFIQPSNQFRSRTHEMQTNKRWQVGTPPPLPSASINYTNLECAHHHPHRIQDTCFVCNKHKTLYTNNLRAPASLMCGKLKNHCKITSVNDYVVVGQWHISHQLNRLQSLLRAYNKMQITSPLDTSKTSCQIQSWLPAYLI